MTKHAASSATLVQLSYDLPANHMAKKEGAVWPVNSVMTDFKNVLISNQWLLLLELEAKQGTYLKYAHQ